MPGQPSTEKSNSLFSFVSTFFEIFHLTLPNRNARHSTDVHVRAAPNRNSHFSMVGFFFSPEHADKARNMHKKDSAPQIILKNFFISFSLNFYKNQKNPKRSGLGFLMKSIYLFLFSSDVCAYFSRNMGTAASRSRIWGRRYSSSSNRA